MKIIMNYDYFLDNKSKLKSYLMKNLKEKYVTRIILEIIDDMFIMNVVNIFYKKKIDKYDCSNYKCNNKIYYKYYREILSSKFINIFDSDLFWKNISLSYVLSKDFIKKYENKINWSSISRYQNLSENFIREFSDKVDWNNISRYQNLSENFIREFSDKVDWPLISEYQNFSENFLIEFKDKINWSEVYYYMKRSSNLFKNI